ncbi:MAG: zinc ABC transporter substrate-binding protein [Halobacteriota archaeon]|nr:zinc ABC transporter substrate-binding protein [Halobacteriota archaeon]
MEKTVQLIGVVFFLAILVFATGCISPGEDDGEYDGGKVDVVVSILPLSEFVEKVGGERVNVAVMIPPGATPHTYEPTPSQLVGVSEADLFIKVGSGVEFELVWMEKIIEQNTEMYVVDCSEGVELIGADPHIWLSPKNAKIMVENICEGLVKADPENSAYYNSNKASYLKELTELDNNLNEAFLGVEEKKFIVFHSSWAYLARDYGLEEVPIEEEGKEPSIEHITEVIGIAKRTNIKVVFSEPQFDPKTAETIAEEIGGVVISIDPLAKNYTENLNGVAEEIVYSGVISG